MVKNSLANQWRFLKESIARPGLVGSVAPSSAALAKAMVNGHDLSQAKVIVELGPGTGAVTQYLLPRMGKDTRLVAIERSAEFVEHLKKEFPQVTIVHGSAEDTPAILKSLSLPRASFIFSSLPWASFGPETQRAVLQGVMNSLSEHGYFATYAYTAASWLPRARSFRDLLARTFSCVKKSRIVWQNLPPAFAYLCEK